MKYSNPMRTIARFLLFLVILFFILMLCQGCGANYHLKRAQSHIRKAKERGAVIEKDTLWAEIVRDSMVFDTMTVLPDPQSIGRDTIRITTKQYSLKIKYDTITRTLFSEVKIPADTIRVPVAVDTSLKAGKSVWYYIPYGIWLLVAGFAIGYFIRSRAGP